jgi:hypothetical protein
MFMRLLPLLFLFAGFQANASIINVTDGIRVGTGDVTGATGILVGTGIYDVTFKEGPTCTSVWTGCSSASFEFTDLTSATFASFALKDQVFGGIFDGTPHDVDPTDTFGITQVGRGDITTPYATGYIPGQAARFLYSAVFQNYIEPVFLCYSISCVDKVGWERYPVNFTYPSGIAVWADWSYVREQDIGTGQTNPSIVPEPHIIALFALGIVGIGFARRRRQA